MKKLMVSGIVLLIMAIAPHRIYARDVIPDKVLNNFQESFPAVKNVHWLTFKDYAEAYFTFDNFSSRIDYSLDGKLLVETRYFTGDLLRKDIVTRILTKFPGKEIFGVTQVLRDSKIEYFIVLRDDKHWYNLEYTPNGKIKLLTILEDAGSF